MNLVLVALDEPLALAWEEQCGEFEFVRIQRGSIFDVACDAVVSPANSFGFMDGGIDMAYSLHFGWHVQNRLQENIRNHHYGELLVGAAEIVETDHVEIPYLIAAPTMRVPMTLSDSVNPFLAARAVLLLARHGIFHSGPQKGAQVADAVQTIAFPGLGTGVGQVSPLECAVQMRAAIEMIELGRYKFPGTWLEAQNRHQLMYRDHVSDLQYDTNKQKSE
jgi:O-acetyl-ADP-ribose deacetylase (regulator of RNase III)